MPRFSLVVPTYGRTDELRRFLFSLLDQDFLDYEVLLMDQNPDERVERLISEFEGQLSFRHFKIARGASRARNIGLQNSNGEIIAFPDDDCWYLPHLLKNVDSWFDSHLQYSILAVGAVDEAGIASGNRWVQSLCDISPLNSFRTTFCSTLFILVSDVVRNACFDEEVGPGTNSGLGGEETDYVLQLLSNGLKGRFDRSWKIGHPRRDMLSGTIHLERAVRYGSGLGRVLRRNSLLFTWLALMGYALTRLMLVVLSGRRSAANLCLGNLRGLFQGFISARASRQEIRQV